MPLVLAICGLVFLLPTSVKYSSPFAFLQTDSCLEGNTAHHSWWRIFPTIVILFPHFSCLTWFFEHCKVILYTVILISFPKYSFISYLTCGPEPVFYVLWLWETFQVTFWILCHVFFLVCLGHGVSKTDLFRSVSFWVGYCLIFGLFLLHC